MNTQGLLKKAAIDILTSQVSQTPAFMPIVSLPFIPNNQSLLPHFEAVTSLKFNDPNFCERIHRLPQIDPRAIYQDIYQTELAVLLHSFLVSAYYWNSDIPHTIIPKNIAIPFCELSKYLDRPPILNIVSTQIHNWKLIDHDKPFHPDNLDSLFTFSGTTDEAQFYIGASYIEHLGTPLIDNSFLLFQAIKEKNEDMTKDALKTFSITIKSMRKAFALIYSRVDPKIFYFGFRNKLKSFEKGIIFEGVDHQFENLMGSSAAQSPIVRLIDTVFDLNKQDGFLARIPAYMKKEHRKFLDIVEVLRPVNMMEAIKEIEAETEWNGVIDEICKFRLAHGKLAVHYISKQSHSKGNTGTGGSEIEEFLSGLIKNTEKLFI